jgi:hypothetical protein
LATRYPVSNSTDAATLEAQCRLLGDDLNDLPEAVLRLACREAARSCKFMPLAAEVYAFAKPHMDKLNADRAHLDSMAAPAKPSPAAVPVYVDPTEAENRAALAQMLERFNAADAKEGISARKVDYTQGVVAPELPAMPDASTELRAFAARRMTTAN